MEVSAVGCWPEGVLMRWNAEQERYSSKYWMGASTWNILVTVCQGWCVLTKQGYMVPPKALGKYLSFFFFFPLSLHPLFVSSSHEGTQFLPLQPPRLKAPFHRARKRQCLPQGYVRMTVLRLSLSTEGTDLDMSIHDSSIPWLCCLDSFVLTSKRVLKSGGPCGIGQMLFWLLVPLSTLESYWACLWFVTKEVL